MRWAREAQLHAALASTIDAMWALRRGDGEGCDERLLAAERSLLKATEDLARERGVEAAKLDTINPLKPSAGRP